jgi:DNA-binding NtrC family response regulator
MVFAELAEQVEVTPLRRRKPDLPLLVRHILEIRSRDLDRAMPAVSPSAMKAIREYGWPGNLGELRACLEWASLACAPVAEIQLWDLPPEVRGGTALGRSTKLSDMVSAVERAAVVEALVQNGNKKIHAALALGISRPTLDKKIAEYKIKLKRSAI